MNKESKNKYLLKNTIILSIGNFGSKLITFFLVPLYTNIFTTKEYGIIDLITIISVVIVPLITLNIQEAVMRYSMDKDAKKEKIFSVGILIMIFMTILGIISLPILHRTSITSEYDALLVMYTLTFGFSQMLLCFIRGQEKLRLYSIINIIQTFIIAILNILFLKCFKFGIEEYILSYIISYCITIILCFIKGDLIHLLHEFSIDKKLAKEMIKYSIILIPNSLMWWIMNSIDRILVTVIINLEANGIYAVSYKIPSIVITLTTIFNQAWMFSAVKEKDSIDKNQYTNSIYIALFNCIVTLSIFLLLILKPLMKIYVGQDFYNAWMYTPPLIIGTIFLTLGTFLSNEYIAYKDSLGFLKSSSIGAIINIVLSSILIPTIGVMGAAIATCVSYIGIFIFRVFDTRNYLKIKVFDNNKIIQIILVFSAAIIVYINSVIIYPILLLIFILELWLTRELWIKIITNINLKIRKRSFL